MPDRRRIEVSRVQALAAQLIESLDKRDGLKTDTRVTKIADAGRAAGVALPVPLPVTGHHRRTMGTKAVKTAVKKKSVGHTMHGDRSW